MASLKQGEFVGSLDCGTTSVRFIIFDRYANIVAQSQAEFPQYYPNPGWHEHDPNEIQNVSERCIAEACRHLENNGWAKESVKVIGSSKAFVCHIVPAIQNPISNLGITNQRETAVAWHRMTGKPLCRAIVWTDSRTRNTVVHYERVLGETGLEVEQGHFKKGEEGASALRDITGLKLSTYFSAIKLRWMIDNDPEVKTAHAEDNLLFGTVESWVVYNLTGGPNGGIHVGDVTNASRTLLMNLRTLQWDDRMLKFFDFRPSILPKLVSSSEVYGHIARGPLKGIPIGGLIGDQQGALVGNKCLKAGEAKCTYGTGAFLLFCTGGEIIQSSNGLLSTVAYQPGCGTAPVYALEGSGKQLRDSMGFIKSANEINDLARSIPDTGGVYFVTAFSGLLAPYWDPAAAGLLIGLSSYTTPAHIARAAIEANAFQTRAILECMKLDSKTDLKHLKVDGGMTNGDACMEILADFGGFDVVRPEMRESTALGSALLAGAAIRLFGWDLSKPETLTEVNVNGSKEFTPHLSPTQRDKAWIGWQRAVERSKGWEEGITA
ncbi:hypothetical protein JVU11DRAFT_6234 [Chiua virens]|nr:hypothetical protein JVU11DRAFT_6234 [Chiua virens]